MLPVKSYKFIISSANCDGDPWDFSLNLPLGLVTCSEGERMRLSLQQWSVLCSWPNITDGNNVIVVNSHNITIPEGNYQLKTLAKLVTESYEAVRLTAEPTLEVTYSAALNKLVFQFSAASTISFVGESYKAFGFASATAITSDASNQIESDGPIKPRLVDSFNIAIRGVNPSSYTYENVGTSELRATKYLLNVPITSPPFGLLTYRPMKEDDGTMLLQDKELTKIRIVINDDTDNLATYIPHSHMVIKIDVFQDDKTGDLLGQLLEFQRLSFVSQGLKAQ